MLLLFYLLRQDVEEGREVLERVDDFLADIESLPTYPEEYKSAGAGGTGENDIPGRRFIQLLTAG